MVSNILSASLLPAMLSLRNKLETPPLPRLRPTVASLPNCSLLAIALRGGERLPPEKNSWVNCYIVAKAKPIFYNYGQAQCLALQWA